VPFLLELLRAPELPDVTLVLVLLTEMAVGESRWCFEARTEVGAFHRTICHAEVARGAALFVELLAHGQAPVRAQAAGARVDECAGTAHDPPALIRLVEDTLANLRRPGTLGQLRQLEWQVRDARESRVLIRR
jgi:hypothetical protein